MHITTSPDDLRPNPEEAERTSSVATEWDEDKDNPVLVLTEQHREIESIFARLEDLHATKTAQSERQALRDELIDKILLHAKIENKFIYPTLASVDAENTVLAEEEHATVKLLLKNLKKISPDDVVFAPKLKILKDAITQHVKREEEELLPMWEASLTPKAFASTGKKIRGLMLRENKEGISEADLPH